MDDGAPFGTSVCQYVNDFDYRWYYQVKSLSGAWGGWVEMNRNPTHHNISVVLSPISAGPRYQWLVMNSCRLATGLDGSANEKQIVDQIFINLPDVRAADGHVITSTDWNSLGNKLTYGDSLSRFTLSDPVRRILFDKTGLCQEMYHFFQQLCDVQGVDVCRRFYSLRKDAGTLSDETKWAAIAINNKGLNRAEWPSSSCVFGSFWDVESGKYPWPRFFGDTSWTDDVDYHHNKRYVFSAPDGHCVNFLSFGGHNYLYDASFGPYAAAGIKADVYGSSIPVPGTPTIGSANDDFRTKYFNQSVSHLAGILWYRHAGSTTTTGPVSSSATEIPVASTVNGRVPDGYIHLGSELIQYYGKTSTSFISCNRGMGGTPAAVHSVDSTVDFVCNGTWNPYSDLWNLSVPTGEVESTGLNLDWME